MQKLVMCIVKSDKFKSQIKRGKNDDKAMWTLLNKSSNQTNCGYISIVNIVSKDVINERSV